MRGGPVLAPQRDTQSPDFGRLLHGPVKHPCTRRTSQGMCLIQELIQMHAHAIPAEAPGEGRFHHQPQLRVKAWSRPRLGCRPAPNALRYNKKTSSKKYKRPASPPCTSVLKHMNAFIPIMRAV